MDTTDPAITFNEDGECSHCTNFDVVQKPHWFPNAGGEKQLDKMIEDLKRDGHGKEYDCVVGLSGGVDSSYIAYLAKKRFDLRPLVVHIDTGWNSELAVSNIENIVKKLDIDLYTHVINWKEMKALQLAFFKSGIANQDIPQDHVFVAILRKLANKHKIKYFLEGGNLATESVLPNSWGHSNLDSTLIKSINKRHGTLQLKEYPLINLFQYYIVYPRIYKTIRIRPLNYMPYSKEMAINTLTEELDWRYYGGKHYESRFTKFFQAYYLPTRFGYDKRKAHLSSLVLSGQMTRDEALAELEKPLYNETELADDKLYVSKKLGISEDEFEELLNAPLGSVDDYDNFNNFMTRMRKIKRMVKG